MGTDMRLLVGEALEPGLPKPAEAAARVRAFLEDFDARLSRFRPDSELSALNADPRPVVPASRLLRTAAGAALEAAHYTSGLVDPTLVAELERTGYADSLDGVEPAPLAEAIAAAPSARPAASNAAKAWRRIEVDDRAGTIARPPGVRLDSGGIGKGLAADLAAEMLRGYSRFVIDCGGDLRVGGPAAEPDPYRVEVEHPLTRERIIALRLGGGGIATSGLNVRIWRTPDGRLAHHLLDPSTGEPAWTGLVGATAVAPTALEAEVLAKAALLSGPERGRDWLGRFGGLLVDQAGEVEYVKLRVVQPARVRFRLPAESAA
jgi:thiamine biosynthesis lipoprotein